MVKYDCVNTYIKDKVTMSQWRLQELLCFSGSSGRGTNVKESKWRNFYFYLIRLYKVGTHGCFHMYIVACTMFAHKRNQRIFKGQDVLRKGAVGFISMLRPGGAHFKGLKNVLGRKSLYRNEI